MLLQIQNPADLPDEPHDSVWVVLLVLVAVVVFIVWKLWPSLVANSIFSKEKKYDYGSGEELQTRKRSAALNILTGVIVLGFGGIVFLVFDAIFPNSNDYRGHHDQFIDAQRLFYMSFAACIANFIYTFLDESSFVDVHNLKYSLKVWLSTMLTSPLVLWLIDSKPSKRPFFLYFNTVVLGHGISIVSLALIIYSVHRISETALTKTRKRLTIILIAEACLLINMFIVALVLHSSSRWLLQVLPYCVIIGLCIWFYPMEKTVFSKTEFYDSEVIE